MGTAKNWFDNYKDPRWQKKRLEIMKRDDFKCRSCGDSESTLNVHHAYYEKGKKPWEYPKYTMITLCESCHKKRHKMRNDILAGIVGLSDTEYFGVYHMLAIASPAVMLEAIGVHAHVLNQTIDYNGLASVIPILANAYEEGKEDAK